MHYNHVHEFKCTIQIVKRSTPCVFSYKRTYFFRESHVRDSTINNKCHTTTCKIKHNIAFLLSQKIICIWCIFKCVFTFVPCEHTSIKQFIWMVFISQYLEITPYFSYITSINSLQRLQICLPWHFVDSYPISSRCNHLFLLILFRTVLCTCVNITSRCIIQWFQFVNGLFSNIDIMKCWTVSDTVTAARVSSSFDDLTCASMMYFRFLLHFLYNEDKWQVIDCCN